MEKDFSGILSQEFKTALAAGDESCVSFWLPQASRQDVQLRRKIIRAAVSCIKSSGKRVRLSSKTARVLRCLTELSRLEERPGDTFHREGYVCLVTSKQRLFIRNDVNENDRLNDRRSLGSKLLVTNVPPYATEQDIVPQLERFGTLVSVRLPLNPHTKLCRGHAFVTFSCVEEAAVAARNLRNSRLRGLLTEPSRRLFVRHIPRHKEPVEVQRSFLHMLPGLTKITMFPVTSELSRLRSDVRNVGYAFLEFQSEQYARLAKTIISIIHELGSDLAADWADPLNPEQHASDASGDV